MKKIPFLLILLAYNLSSQGLVSQYENGDGYFARFGLPPQNISDNTNNLLIGDDRIQTILTGFQSPPSYPPLLLNPIGGNVGIGLTLPQGKLDVFHNSDADSPTLLITEEGQDQGRIQFRNTINPAKYFEIRANPGGPGLLTTSFNMGYYDGANHQNFFRYTADQTLEINTGTNKSTYINYSPSNPGSNELRVGTVNGGQNVNIKHAMRMYNNGETSYWDIKSTDRLTFGRSDGITTGDVAYIDSDGEYHQISDARLKENIQPLENCLSKVLALRPTSYNFRKDTSTSSRTFGFIAQEVNLVVPEAVAYDAVSDIYSVAYRQFIVLAVGAIQEQTIQLEKLQEKQALQGIQVARLKARLNELLENSSK